MARCHRLRFVNLAQSIWYGNMKIAAIGDSITYGFPYSSSASWLDIAARHFGLEYLNRGVNGDTTSQMMRRFIRDVSHYHPTHVIVMGGTNDVFESVSTKEIMDNIVRILALARDDGMNPILGLPIPCSDLWAEKQLSEYRSELRTIALAQSIHVIDFYSAMAGEGGLGIKSCLYCDGVHPNEAGYEVMTAVAIEFMERSLMMHKKDVDLK